MLDKIILAEALSRVYDKDAFNFIGFPSTAIQGAVNIANAINLYAKNVVPLSTTSEVAKAALISVLSAANLSGNGRHLFPLAIKAYADALALGMTGAGFTGIAPILPPNLEPSYSIGMMGATGSIVAEAQADIIHAWFLTGIAVNISSGATINWT